MLADPNISGVSGANGGYIEGARVYNDADLTIADSVQTNLTFNQERYDTDSIHSILSNTERLTCKTAGKYIIGGHCRFEPNGVGSRLIDIYLNGTTMIARDERLNSGAAAAVTFSIVTYYDLVVNDYVTLYVYQTSGGNLKVTYNPKMSPEFWMHRIG